MLASPVMQETDPNLTFIDDFIGETLLQFVVNS